MIRGWRAVILAVLLAALVGGAMTGGLIVLVILFFPLITGGLGGFGFGDALAFLVLCGVCASAVFAVGLSLVGAPVWAVMHARGLRSRRHAVTAGGLLAGSAVFLLSAPGGWEQALGGLFTALLVFFPGRAAGWTLHRFAYGPKPSP